MTRHFLLLLTIFMSLAQTTAGQDRYDEPYRPQFHFSPERNWMNDPNGMVYFDGEWHLFYQYNPFGDRWGHMHWGHAVSEDLVHWTHLPIALVEEGVLMMFSGSAVVDWKNTSGFGINGQPPLVAIFTGHRPGRQDQRLAFSNDRGRTWTKFDENPVLDVNMADFRDPKVFWHEPSQRWIMTLALATEQKVHFYHSPDLKQWQYVGEFGPAGAVGGLWECPDLFELPLPGDQRRWVLIVNINPGGPVGGSGCQYFIGQFDGKRFVPDAPAASMAEFVPEGTVIADFENGWSNWTVQGSAFGSSPARGTLDKQQPVTGFRGQALVNSFQGGDQSTGKLSSPEFTIQHRFINFLRGGGSTDATRIVLLVDGQVVKQASGNEKGREKERLTWHAWDVSEFVGRNAKLEIIDESSEGWGHINVDHIFQSDEAARSASDEPLWADLGADFYAAVTWSDVPRSDGRRLWLGWMSNWNYANDVPTAPWRSAMSVPRELYLFETPDGVRLGQRPIHELDTLATKTLEFPGSPTPGNPVPGSPATTGTVQQINHWVKQQGIETSPQEWTMEWIPDGSHEMGVRLFASDRFATTLSVSADGQEISIDRHRSGNVDFHKQFPIRQTAKILGNKDRIRLRVLVDTSSIEVFVNDGQTVLTSLIFPAPQSRQVEFFGPKESAPFGLTRVRYMRSIW